MSNATIPATLLQFLEALKDHNDRDWFNENKPRYQKAHKAMKAFAQQVHDLMSHHDQIEKVKLHRIYRDIRFSKDKTPYKTNFGMALMRATKWRRGGYYLHIEPGNSFVGGGFWEPNSDDLKRIRQDIAANPDELRKILADPVFRKTFGELRGDQLKTAPRGFTEDHPAIDLLRYKQFLISRAFSDKEVLNPDFAEVVVDTFHKMRPFFDYMSEVLTTDENGTPIV